MKRSSVKGRNPWLSGILLVFLVLFLLLRHYYSDPEPLPDPNADTGSVTGPDRDPSRLSYSKHARCRMECRKIDKDEVEEILTNGTINFAKSDTGSSGDPRYALEGITSDNQRVRIVVAAAEHATVLVTCIDLDRDWPCRCD